MLSVFVRLRSLFRAIRHHQSSNDDMDAEFRHHMELRAKDLVRTGLSPADARRRARLEFGSTESYKDRGREARGLRAFDWLRLSSLDLKLGGRMLVKHPGLTTIGTIAVAFAICVGTVTFELVKQAVFPTIPLPAGNEIVGVQNSDVQAGVRVASSRRDFEIWKQQATTLRDLGAVAVQIRNVAIGSGDGEPVNVAEVTSSIFRLTRVPAFMGRTLLDSDEPLDAPNVVVVAYDFWQNNLGASPDVIGRVIRVSGMPATIVGVMPRGYSFPVRNGLWSPLHLDAFDERARRLSFVFGRLPADYTFEEAQAQLATIASRTAAEFPETHKNLRGQISSLPRAILGLSSTESMLLGSTNLFLVILLALVCSNVALLLFARAASRQTEIVVRTALGASRGRIVTQLFGEALVLCALGAVMGLGATNLILGWVRTIVEGQMGPLPFWVGTSLSPVTIAYAAALTLLAATIAGVVPALKVTSGGVDARLRAMSSGGGGLQFGGVWTVVIVIQIALTVTLPMVTSVSQYELVRYRDTHRGFAADEFLIATIALDRSVGAPVTADTSATARAQRLEARYRTLVDRLSTEPGVVGVTYADRLPLMYHPHRIIELDAGPAAPRHPQWPTGYRVSSASVDPRFFDVIGAPVIRGRSLSPTDAEQDTRAVLVNEAFVKRVMGGLNPLGRQVRVTYMEGERRSVARPPGPWLEIVGIVPDLGVSADAFDPKVARIYEAALPGKTNPLRLTVHVRGDPQRFVPTLRELASAIDPAFRVMDPQALPRVLDAEIEFMSFWVRMLTVLTAITLVLSLAGVYAVMAFAVAKRTREIGVRVALGATPRQIILAIFKRPFIQIAGGIFVGAVFVASLIVGGNSNVAFEAYTRLAVFVLFAMVCCALACVIPTRRALRIQPTEALKDEG